MDHLVVLSFNILQSVSHLIPLIFGVGFKNMANNE